jgi:hypothetical protein
MIETIRTSEYTIKQILQENWDSFYNKHQKLIRPVVTENVKKVMSCGDKNILGYNLYVCPVCRKRKYVAHTCKSRFCNSCGKVKNDEWIEKAQTRLFNIPHKHLVLTIPWELRLLFLENRHTLSYLHQATGQAILDWAKTVHLLPGIVTVLHTFGAKLNFNCHIHTLYSLGGVDLKSGQFKKYNFIPAQSIKTRFKTILLHKLRKEFVSGKLYISSNLKNIWLKEFRTDIFFEVQNKLWEKEWYLWIGEELESATHTVAYVGRYAKRPCLSEAKITAYEPEFNLVRFVYKDKLTKENVDLNLTIDEFIGALVRHIPEKGFNMIRYYGMYANILKERVLKILADRLIYLYGQVYLLFEPKVLSWRDRIKRTTRKDPLVCQRCQKKMILIEIHYHTRDGTPKCVPIY